MLRVSEGHTNFCVGELLESGTPSRLQSLRKSVVNRPDASSNTTKFTLTDVYTDPEFLQSLSPM